jgi:trehalose-phosphatase
MKDLRKHWPEFESRIRLSRRCCILSDLDGTLVPVVERPDLIEFPDGLRDRLARMSRLNRFILGIVSGRERTDLVARVGIEGLWYVGNHGFEVRDPLGRDVRHFTEEDVRFLDGVRDELAAETSSIPGVILEHKGPIVAVHYRLVDPGRIPEVESAFLKVLGRRHPRIMFFHGRMVLEARISGGANKGSAVRHIRRNLPPETLPVYFGDDLTDRDAFRELEKSGITVEVGGSDSGLAHHTLPDSTALWEVLARMEKELG